MPFIINPYWFVTAGGLIASKTFLSGQINNANATTYNSWTAVTPSASDTGLVIGIVHSGSSQNFSSGTVTGNVSGAQTLTLQTSLGAATPWAGIATAPLASDTSATISITFSGGTSRCGIFVWSVQNTNLTADAVNTADTTSPYAATITTPSDGVGFACTIDENTGSPTVTWTTYTEDSETLGESNRRYSAGSIAGSDSTGPTATYTASSGGRLAVATFNHT